MGRYKSEKFNAFKRKIILDAAAAEFQENGLEKSSMRAIASRAELTTGAIYSMFEGREALYQALLAQSLEDLRSHMEARVQHAHSGIERVEEAIIGFYEYYADKAFEVQLGMHSFSGMRPSSLGETRDRDLNSSLLAALDIIGAAISELSPSLNADQIKRERDAIFASLIGTLSLAHTGRARSIGTTAEQIIKHQMTALTTRLSEEIDRRP